MAARHEEGDASKSNKIVRFMFFEAFARIGIHRYHSSGFFKDKPECETPAEAVEKAFATLR